MFNSCIEWQQHSLSSYLKCCPFSRFITGYLVNEAIWSYKDKMNDVRGSWLKGSHIGKMSIYSRPGKIYYCTGLTDFYSLAAQGNRCNNYDIVQMSFNQLKWASSKRVSIKLTNTENIKMFFCRATESANVGWVIQCTCFWIFSRKFRW